MSETRYSKIKKIMDSMPVEVLRMCPSYNDKDSKGCACLGCVSAYGIRKHELELYLKGELK
jgi:hypothetical protein